MIRRAFGLHYFIAYYLRTMALYLVITIALATATLLVMAFLARPLVGAMLIAAFISGFCLRRTLKPFIIAGFAPWVSAHIFEPTLAPRETPTDRRAA